jgi:phosphatidylinositol alpha-mannosyltransferase
MRIGMVCPYSLSVPGGVQAQVMGLAFELRRLGVEVRVLAPCDGPPPATFVTPLGKSLPTAGNGSVAPLAPDPSCQLRTIRALTEEAFDVLHIHEPFIPGATQTAVLTATAPILATFHAAGDSSAYRYLRRPILAASHRIAHRVAVSKDARELVHRYVGGEYEILFNGVDLDLYRQAPAMATAGPTIFFLGRHEERKGLGVLLAAVQQLPPDVTVWIAGTGPDTAALQATYAGDQRLQWLGRISETDKIARMKGATVYCAPSLHGESFGVVLVEAMAAGTAIVASALDGYRNVATDGVDAMLVQPGNVDQLAAALRELLAAPDRRIELIAAGQRRADDFSMRTLAELYIARYEQLIVDAAQSESPRARRWSRMLRRAFGQRADVARSFHERSPS